MKFDSYAQAESFLGGLINYEKMLGGGHVKYDTKSFDLERFRDRLRALGDPHLRYSSIHVAGTKGKGSTCAYLESILSVSGLKVGLYTSPHIDSYCERISISGENIPESRFCDILGRLAGLMADGNGNGSGECSTFRTVFELLTATAFVYFAEEEVDVAVVETGLGGRLDSTNVFDVPATTTGSVQVSVITAIGYDHMEILGNTIAQIASEKAGILRAHAPAILAAQPEDWLGDAEEAVRTHAAQIGLATVVNAADLIHAHPRPTFESFFDPDGLGPACGFQMDSLQFEALLKNLGIAESDLPRVPLCDALLAGVEAHPPLQGTHQTGNLQTALAALVVFEITRTSRLEASKKHAVNVAAEGGDWPMHQSMDCEPEPPSGVAGPSGSEVIRRGIAHTVWPGRFEVLSRQPLVIVDGAHCPLSTRAMAETSSALLGARQVVLVAGFMRDKDLREICGALKGRMHIARIIACEPPSPRARPASEAAATMADLLGVEAEAVPSPELAMQKAVSLLHDGQALVAFGSLYLIGPVRKFMQDRQIL
ncbi:MAG: hypothetical protein K1X53_13385 [Candidatus Sumerlaeaceae bacterium]|nr:hypothetical protein [Candidatus Sumerlaeaceae bacterium]